MTDDQLSYIIEKHIFETYKQGQLNPHKSNCLQFKDLSDNTPRFEEKIRFGKKVEIFFYPASNNQSLLPDLERFPSHLRMILTCTSKIEDDLLEKGDKKALSSKKYLKILMF